MSTEVRGARLSLSGVPCIGGCAAPFGCVYAPMQRLSEEQYCDRAPALCSSCGAVMNPYCRADFARGRWTCAVCGGESPLRAESDGALPAELRSGLATADYAAAGDSGCARKVALLVVDLCASARELCGLRRAVADAIAALDESSFVGLVTFGNGVYVNQLCVEDGEELQRSFGFGGSRCYSAAEVQRFTGLSAQRNRVFMRKGDAVRALEAIVDSLEPDAGFAGHGKRAQRCTGAALDVALSLVEIAYRNSGAQILLFTSGPITKGPGAMASLDIADKVRTQRDVLGKNGALSESSHRFFSDMAIRAVTDGVVVNYVSASFEDTGLYEMFDVVHSTGGFVMSCESYFDENISKSLNMYFREGILKNSGVNCVMTLNLPKYLNVCGCIGPCVSTLNKTGNVSKIKIGHGDTIQWKVSGMIEKNTYTFIFDVNSSKLNPIPENTFTCFQIVTKYSHFETGANRLRVTTIPINFYDISKNKQEIVDRFDQETTAAILAKITIFNKMQRKSNVIKELDQKLIDICHTYGNYKPKDCNSFYLQDQLKFLPQFIYQFRLSQFFSTYNITLDQATAYMSELLNGNVSDLLLMIHPSLKMYSVDEQPKYVNLEESSLNSESILLLDTYFRVLIWHGKSVVEWKKNGYQTNPEYENFKSFLEQPISDASALLSSRFPISQTVICDADSSESRYLLSKCNPPPTTPFGQSKPSPAEQSYSDFYSTLCKLSVK